MFLVESAVEPAEVVVAEGAIDMTLAEILYEAEASYGNLCRRMMEIEHKSIITENAELVTEGVKEFWETFKAWVVKWFNQIINYFKGLTDKIASMVQSDAKWLAEIKAKHPSLGSAKAKVYPNIANGKAISALNSLSVEIIAKKSLSGESAKNAFMQQIGVTGDSMSSAIKNHIMGGAETVESTVNAGAAIGELEKAMALSKETSKILSALKAEESSLSQLASAAKDEERKQALFAKEVAIQRVSAFQAYVSALNAVRGQLKTVIIAGVAAGRGAGKEAAPAKESASLFEGIVL